jgi:hypothetical protein
MAGEVLPPNVALIPVEHILGLPWFYWGFVAFGVIIMFLIIIFIYYYVTMGPVGAYFWSAWNNSDLLLFGRKSGKLSLRESKYLTGIFNDKNYPLSWIQRSSSSFRLGKCSTKLVVDTTGIASEPELNMAIKTFVAEYNDQEYRKQADAYNRGLVYEPDFITDYYDLYKAVKEGKVNDPVAIPAVFEVPLWEIERYLPHIGSGDLEGHIATRIEEDKVEEDKADKSMPAWVWMALIIGGIIFGVFTLINIFGKG